MSFEIGVSFNAMFSRMSAIKFEFAQCIVTSNVLTVTDEKPRTMYISNLAG